VSLPRKLLLYLIFSSLAVSVIPRPAAQHGGASGVMSVLEREGYVRIAKPLLLVTTPLGLLEGFYECYKLAGGLLFLMVAMVGVMVAALGNVVATIRREERASKARST
jgi:hypothetical protein